jgi:hypothetical protein
MDVNGFVSIDTEFSSEESRMVRKTADASSGIGGWVSR